MRRTFTFVAVPLAAAALVPVLLIGRAGPHARVAPPWGIDAARHAELAAMGAQLGLRPASVFVAAVGGTAPDTRVLLEGKTPRGRVCAFFVRGGSHGPLRCLDAVLRQRPYYAVAFADEVNGAWETSVVGFVRSDVGRVVELGSDGRPAGGDILAPGRAFDFAVPGRAAAFRLYGGGGRLLASVRLRP